jgi:two-component system, OmpR family, phosphate regulon response regulator PhoB
MNTSATLILIVEDDMAIADMLAAVLRENGYQTLIAPSAGAAMELLAEVRPTVMTLDAALPGISGSTLLWLLRQNEATRELPIIMISAMTQLEREVGGSVEAFIHKPFNLDHVLRKVAELARSGRVAPA